MANILYANNAVGTLASGITNAATSLTLNPGQAALFPTPVPPQVFYVTLTDAATQTLIEIVQVTAVAGNIFSIVRGRDGTTALSWNAGDIVSQRTIALELRGFENAAEGLFGATGQNVTITPSSTLGIKGTILADNANAGSVGEYTTATGSLLTISNGVSTDLTAVALTAGDWDVVAEVVVVPSGVTTVNGITLASTATSGLIPGLGFQSSAGSFLSGFGNIYLSTPPVRFTTSTGSNAFATVNVAFSGGSCQAQGLVRARRVR